MHLRSSIGPVLATALLIVAACALHVVIEHRFFYWDDAQHTFAPVFYTIGEQLRAGEWPTTTLLLWQGGFLAGEGLYQVFNPVSLAVFAMLPSIDDVALGMALHATVWLVIAGTGVYALAARLGALPAWAILAGFSYATSPFLLYWLAASWVNGAVGFAALPWALFFLATPRLRAAGALGIALSTYVVGVSGWIHAIVPLVLFGSARVLLPDRAVAARDRAAFALALAAGALTASPQLLATAAAVQGGMRPSNISNIGTAVASLQGLATAFWPTYTQPARWFSESGWSPPLYYAAWFVLPAVAMLAGRWRQLLMEFRWLVWPALVLLVATLGPDQLGPTRWPIRLLPAAWAAVIPLAAVVISRHGGEQHPHRSRHLGVALALAALLSWQQHPGGALTLLFFWCVLWGMSILVLRRPHFVPAHFSRPLYLGATLLITAWMAAEYPANTAFDDYFGPAHRSSVPAVGVSFPASVVQVYSRLDGASSGDRGRSGARRPPDPWNDTPLSNEETLWVPSGNMPLWRRERQVNGYTPVEMLSLKTMTCGQSIFGWTCDGPAPTLFAREPGTGRSYADLMRVDAFVVSSRMPESLDYLSGLPDWQAETPSRYATVFRRIPASSPPPGTISYLPPGVQVVSHASFDTDDERVTVDRPAGFTGGLIAFARAYYPGHSILIDRRPVPVVRLGGVVLAARLPPGQGPVTVDVRHRLPMPSLWRACVLLGLVAILAAVFLSRRPSSAPRTE